jgi:hypothetical protein
MLTRGAELTFAKQPVIEGSTGIIVGYVGVDWFDFEGRRRLEFGYRLASEVRGLGYATERAEPCSPPQLRRTAARSWRSSTRPTAHRRTSPASSGSASGSRPSWRATSTSCTGCASTADIPSTE